MEILEIWGNILYPLCAIIIPVLATVYTLNIRLKNENKEKHQPYLVLEKIDNLFHLNKNRYYLTINDELEIINANQLKINLELKNIGYGVATNVKFYNLLTGCQISGNQEIKENLNQKLFTTFDIPNGENREVQVVINYNKMQINMNRILCVYQDLNHNVYDFIIAINIKNKNKFDYFSYQPSSLSYQRWIKENRSHKERILKNYKNL
ncbi:MAG: hypothetical protein IJB71_05140 [Bacilli bacterium]|nr:hypothetical protein [Bacilli bacterium]